MIEFLTSLFSHDPNIVMAVADPLSAGILGGLTLLGGLANVFSSQSIAEQERKAAEEKQKRTEAFQRGENTKKRIFEAQQSEAQRQANLKQSREQIGARGREAGFANLIETFRSSLVR